MDEDLATSDDQFSAFRYDWLILVCAQIVIWPIVLTYFSVSIFSIVIISAITFLFADLLFDLLLDGRSFGKRKYNLYVSKLDGSEPEFYYHLLRILLRPLNIVTLGILRKVKIKGQPASNLLSGTMIIYWGSIISEPIPSPQKQDRPEAPESLISNIAEASKNARSIYLLYIGLLAYTALTVAGTSDRRIILNEPARLPVINLDVSLDGFFILAPILSIFVFIYFQLYLNKLKRLRDELRSDYQPVQESQKIYPWMLNFFDELKTGFLAWLQRLIVDISVWWSLPVVLMFLAWWYLKKHDPVYTSIVGAMPLIAAFFVISFYLHYQQPDCKLNWKLIKSGFKKYRNIQIMVILVLIFEIHFFVVFTPVALRGKRILGGWPAVDLSYQNLVHKEDAEFKTVHWADLSNAQLQGANLKGTVLKKADLRKANLKDANLSEANLIEANLENAHLENANLEKADLTGAVLYGADLSSAVFRNTDLRDAKFNNKIKVQGATFANNKIDYDSLKMTVQLKTTKYRSEPDSVSWDSAKSMISKHDFYDRRKNPESRGKLNMFELQRNGKVVYDYGFDLMWQQSGSQKYMIYEDALKWIASLNVERFAGYSDWRLPTLEEAMSLMEPQRNENYLYINPIFDSRQPWIWTADRVKGESWAWVVHFYFGGCNTYDLLGSTRSVRAVRPGQSSVE